jgi:hypothetical protein
VIEIIKSLNGWQMFAYLYIGISIIANVVFTLVISVGGIFDLKHLFSQLKKETDEFNK